MSTAMQIFLQVLLTVAAANAYPLLAVSGWFIIPLLAMVVVANSLPLFYGKELPTFRLRICAHGNRCLKSFAISVAITVALQVILLFSIYASRHWMHLLLNLALCIVVEAVLFWNGMICVYASSIQLGIQHRAVGILLGLVPVANLVMLFKILKITGDEIDFELKKHHQEEGRKDQFLCKTKYPILLVHGICFRDNPYLNYWGRIPKTLKKNGSVVYYGEHPSALSIEESARILADRITLIVRNSGCEKVNIIAHSKGGLDCRYAMEHLGIAQYVASLTTINTPHRGCVFADELLSKVPKKIQDKIAATYNNTLRQLGDPNPDFMAAVQDLTSSHCVELDAAMPMPEGVYCQSFGSLLHSKAKGGFPFNLFYRYVKNFDGPNDGLVGEESFAWGENYQLITIPGKRGLSHLDIIDLTMENIPEFDVREFYVQLVSDLKNRGF